MRKQLAHDIAKVRELVPDIAELTPHRAFLACDAILHPNSVTAEQMRYATLVRDHALGII